MILKKKSLIKELIFEEYIHQENNQKYLNIIKDKNNQIENYFSKIHELELDKKNNTDKNNLHKEIFVLNKKIDNLMIMLMLIIYQKKN